MKRFSKLARLISVLAVGVTILGTSVASVYATAAPSSQETTNKHLVSGPQAKLPFEPGTKDAKAMTPLGSTEAVAVNDDGTLKNSGSITPQAGNVAGVDFQAFYNYCSKNLIYTTVRNTTAATKYVQVRVLNKGSFRELSTSIAPGGAYVYPAFAGVDGAYTAYLYVWNGTTYQYDELKSSNNTCNVSVTRVVNAGGWVQLKIQNLGTAYATQVSTELAPFPAAGTYTGTHYDYPVAGGAAIYRWFQVGTQPYGIVSSTSGSFNAPVLFSGDL